MSDQLTIAFAKLAGLQKVVKSTLNRGSHTHDPQIVLEYFTRYNDIANTLRSNMPDLFDDLPKREIPKPIPSETNEGRGYVFAAHVTTLAKDIDYVFEVRSNSRINEVVSEQENRIFISHGRSTQWYKLQSHLEKTLKLPTLELAQEANLGRTVLQKLMEESDKCNYAIIVMTGDDQVGELSPRARENVMHEIGFFQGKYGPRNVCLLYEEGTSLPSNIHGLVYIPFTKDYIEATFGAIARELDIIYRK